MKLRNLFFASLAMVTFAACSNDDEPGIENNEPQDASFVMNITTSALTKADTQNGSTTPINESKISELKVYVYAGDNYFSEIPVVTNNKVVDPATDKTQSEAEPSYSVNIEGLKTNTAYTLVAIANPHFIGDNIDLKASKTALLGYLQGFTEQFSNDGNFTMFGFYATTGLLASPETNSATINISRRLAAVEIEKITMKLSDDIIPAFRDANAYLDGICLINVRENSKTGNTTQDGATGIDNDLENDEAKLIHGNIWSSKDEVKAAANAKLYQNYNSAFDLGIANLDQEKTITGVYNRLYGFPTNVQKEITKENQLRFLLKIRYVHSTATNIRYYNIFVNENEILNNTLYKIQATITGIGSKDPDVVEETAADIDATINVLPWQVAVQTEENLKD